MKRIMLGLQSFAATIGGPGLFIIAFLDSSFVALPEVNDLLVITAVIEHPYRLVYYAFMATAGSILGCLALYAIGRRGGARLVRSRFGADRLVRATVLFQRWGLLSILVPSLLPPPAPFKIFMLLAGVVGVPVWQFVVALLIGRGARFLALGILAARYGREAIEFLHTHQRSAALVTIGLLVLGAVVWIVWQRLEPRNAAGPEA
jgi:membrane protein YqaA with SNARE-associated domain